MNAALRLTFLMGLIAAVTCVAASWFYPWPVPDSERLGAGQGLFKPFEASRVWSLDILAFRPETQTLDRFALQKQGERWLVPGQAGFPSDNVARRTAIINALVNLTNPKSVLEQRTDRKEDHVKYGVVDPAELQEKGSRAGVGTRITLEDRNRQTLATVIVGLPIEDEQRKGQAFVRIPGQPQVYLAEFSPEILTVTFGDWVDPNLFQLRTVSRADGELPLEIEIANSAATQAAFAAVPAIPGAWKATAVPAGDAFATQNIEIPAGDSWVRAVLPAEVNQLIVESVRRLGGIPVFEVRAREKELGDALSTNPLAGPPALYAGMVALGFRQTAEAGQPLRFESAGGRVRVVTGSGIAISMYLGELFSKVETDSNLARYAMFHAALDQSRFPEPEAPVAVGGVEPTDEQRREFNRLHEAWKKKIDAGREMVSALNSRHGRWYYVLDENVVSRVMPTLPKLEPVTPPAATQPEAAKPATGSTEKDSAGDGNS